MFEEMGISKEEFLGACMNEETEVAFTEVTNHYGLQLAVKKTSSSDNTHYEIIRNTYYDELSAVVIGPTEYYKDMSIHVLLRDSNGGIITKHLPQTFTTKKEALLAIAKFFADIPFPLYSIKQTCCAGYLGGTGPTNYIGRKIIKDGETKVILRTTDCDEAYDFIQYNKV